MRFSVITPTHDVQYLQAAYGSLCEQTVSDWEWVLVPNNGAVIPPAITQDQRVRIVAGPSTPFIGALKHFAFSQGSGAALVELDHDDMLVPTCLAELAVAFGDPSVGFAYSYAAHLGNHKLFAQNHGWEYCWLDWCGQKLVAPKTFEPSPASIAYGWYAPNHVRAWRKSVYDSLGGHDKTMEVGDDFDLLARTYLSTKMRLIPRPLYIQRSHDGNTSVSKSARIQAVIRAIYEKYIYRLTEHWSDLNGLHRLDLCGAIGSPYGYTSLDMQPPADLVCDLESGIPFPDNSVGIIRAHDALEHIRDKVRLISEVHRVLVDGGWLLSLTPSTDGRGAFQDPTHVSFWNENSFWYWTRPQQAKYVRNDAVRFQEFRLDTSFPSKWHEEHKISYVKADLRAVKSSARRPHYLPVWGSRPTA